MGEGVGRGWGLAARMSSCDDSSVHSLAAYICSTLSTRHPLQECCSKKLDWQWFVISQEVGAVSALAAHRDRKHKILRMPGSRVSLPIQFEELAIAGYVNLTLTVILLGYRLHYRNVAGNT